MTAAAREYVVLVEQNRTEGEAPAKIMNRLQARIELSAQAKIEHASHYIERVNRLSAPQVEHGGRLAVALGPG